MDQEEYDKINPYGLETESDFHLTRRNTTLSIVKNHIDNKNNSTLLDVGCGKGLITKHIKENIANLKIDAIDISEKAIEQANNDSLGINFSFHDAINFNGFGYKYDVIVLNNIYEHVENPVGILKNLKNLLKPDGIFIISTPNRYNTRNIIKKIFGLPITIPQYHITEYSTGQLYDHHLYAGLRIKQIITPKFKREKFKLSAHVFFTIIEPLLNVYYKALKSQTKVGSVLFIISEKPK